MPSIEAEIKQQFVRLFVRGDALLFKRMAEYHLRNAVTLRSAEIKIDQDLKLLARNAQKRLGIGIGIELLLKAIYLFKGFSINKIETDQAGAPAFPFTFASVAGFNQATDQTYMLNDLIDHLSAVIGKGATQVVVRGLKIAKVFRNKEGHVVLPTHSFEPSNYRDIEAALVSLYAAAFGEKLTIRFSVARGERGVWCKQ